MPSLRVWLHFAAADRSVSTRALASVEFVDHPLGAVSGSASAARSASNWAMNWSQTASHVGRGLGGQPGRRAGADPFRDEPDQLGEAGLGVERPVVASARRSARRVDDTGISAALGRPRRRWPSSSSLIRAPGRVEVGLGEDTDARSGTGRRPGAGSRARCGSAPARRR